VHQAEQPHLLPQASCSPDIAPRNFFVFGVVKQELAHIHGQTQNDTFDSVERILRDFPSDAMKSGFTSQMSRLQQVIDTDGSDI
jgi:hypothetical protein